MIKFTSINENYIFGKIILSYKDFKEYQDLVKLKFSSLYDNIIEIEGISFVAKQDFDTPNRLKSIINYSNSNILLCSWIVDYFNCNTKLELFNIISTEYANLFSPSGKYFDIVLSKLRLTESNGIKNEEFAAEVISDFLKKKNIDSKVYRTETDCRDDLFLGIDLYFMYNGKKITCQVKPFKSISIQGESIKIESSGKLKPYSVNYLIFADFKTRTSCLFRNIGVTYYDKTATIPKTSEIKTEY
jgi:hypothetical protein